MTAPHDEDAVDAPTVRTDAARAADKFFSLGMVAAIAGSVLTGAYLWLGLNGQMRMPSNYGTLRSLHSSLQLHYFLGAFIAGFLLQAAPRVLQSRATVPSAARYAFPLLAVGFLLRCIGVERGASLFTAIAYAWCLAFLFPVFWRVSSANFIRTSIPCAVSLLALAVSTALDLSDVRNALAVVWWGIVPVILAMAQHVLADTSRARKLSIGEAAFVFGLFVLSGSSLCVFLLCEDPVAWTLFAAFSFCCFFSYIVCIRLYSGFLHPDPFHRVVVLGWTWALIGSAVAIRGPQEADTVLHLWATGLAVTMILAVSSRVVTRVTSIEVLPPGLFYAVGLSWQVVPFGRALQRLTSLPPSFSWAVGVCAGLALFAWIVRIAFAISSFIGRNRGSVVLSSRTSI